MFSLICAWTNGWTNKSRLRWFETPSHSLWQFWNIVNSNLRNKLQCNLKQNSYIFIKKNSFQNVVCEMTASWSRPQCVKNPTVWLDDSIIRSTQFAYVSSMYHNWLICKQWLEFHVTRYPPMPSMGQWTEHWCLLWAAKQTSWLVMVQESRLKFNPFKFNDHRLTESYWKLIEI